MGSPRKRYSREFKVETVRKILQTGQSQADVAVPAVFIGRSCGAFRRWSDTEVGHTPFPAT